MPTPAGQFPHNSTHVQGKHSTRQHWAQSLASPSEARSGSFLYCKALLHYRQQVTESYDFKRAVPVMRRDLRSGKATAQAHITKTGVAIHAHWSAPLAGVLVKQQCSTGASQLC
jgi:hypothetical protein